MRLLFCLPIALCVAGGVSGADRDDGAPSGAQPAIASATAAQPQLQLYIPNAIDPRVMQDIIDRLALRPDQIEGAQKYFKEYHEACDAFSRELIDLQNRSADFAGENRRLENDARAEQYVAFWADRDKVVQKLGRLEDLLLAQIGALLDDAQSVGLQEARMRLLRDRCAYPPVHYPGSHIDLSEFADQFVADAGPQALSDIDGFRSALREYEVIVTPLFRSRYEKALQSSRNATLLQEAYRREFGAGPSDMPSDARQAFMRERERVLAPPVTSAKSIAALNEAYLKRLSACIDAAYVEELGDRYLQEAYPSLFPNPYEMEHVLIAPLLALDALDAADRDQVLRMIDEYRLRDEEIDLNMMLAFNKYSEGFARTFATQAAELKQFRNAMSRLHRSRRDNASALLDGLSPVLAPREDDQLRRALESARDVLAVETEPPTFALLRALPPRSDGASEQTHR